MKASSPGPSWQSNGKSDMNDDATFDRWNESASQLSSPRKSQSTSPAAKPNGIRPSIANGSSRGPTGLARANVDPRIREARTKLPIWIARDAIVDSVRQNDTVIVLGETGSGKTTQIPQFLFDAGFSADADPSRRAGKKMIAITQPRRVAAISLAKRVAVELGVPEPDKDPVPARQNSLNGSNGSSKKATEASRVVGYSVRFDDRTSKDTRIKFMTDGWLLRELLSSTATAKNVKGKRKSEGEMDVDGWQSDSFSYSLLEQYSVIIIDEAHERSVHTDVVIGLIKRVQRRRKDIRKDWLQRKAESRLTAEEASCEPSELKVIVMSATIDAEHFARFYGDERGQPAPILYIKGRQFPLQLFHAEQSCANWVETCKRVLVQISEMEPGDVLVFMTGAEEIESFASELEDLSKGLREYALSNGRTRPSDFVVTKLYAALGGEAIRKCFAPTPPGCRKIVLATNIAETSITISGIKYVIDCGLAKERTFRTSTISDGGAFDQAATIGASVELLAVKSISKAAARQRAGRAGRESGGRCFRLFTEKTFDGLPDSDTPEILRTDLSSVVLDVFAMGLDPLTFDWLDRPQDEDLQAAVVALAELGALEVKTSPSATSSQADERHFRLTKLGREMSKLPLLPALSKTILAARDIDDEEGKVFEQALDIVSILSTERRTILIEPSSFVEESTDSSKDNAPSRSKREEADRARQRFVHPSGDHATQLQALLAYREAEESSSQQDADKPHKDANGNGAATGVLRTKRSKDGLRLKEWCKDNFVSLKAVREVFKIRSQILQIFKRNNWIPSNAEGLRTSIGVGVRRALDGRSNQSDASDDDDEDAMLVTKGSAGTSHADTRNGHKEDYALLRQCLLQGKRVNTAFRQEQSNVYRRTHGGDMRFRIHPSSSLMLALSSDGVNGPSRLPSVIYFEDMAFTSQLFARTVSAIEATWLTDLNVQK